MSEFSRYPFQAKKSPFNFEIMQSGDELAYAKTLEADPQVLAWTKKHNILIRYRNKKAQIARYLPDFLVRRKDQMELELVEVKGGHLMHDPDTQLKAGAATDWCRQRGMRYCLISISA